MKKNIALFLSLLFISSCGNNTNTSSIKESSNIESIVSSTDNIESSSNETNDFKLVLYKNLENDKFIINNKDIVEIDEFEALEFYYYDDYSIKYDENKFDFQLEKEHAYLTSKQVFNNEKVEVSNGTNQIEFYINSKEIEKETKIQKAYINLCKKYDKDLTNYTFVNLLMNGNYEFFNNLIDITTLRPGTTLEFSCEYFINGPKRDILYIDTYPSINYGKINEVISVIAPTYVPYIYNKANDNFSLEDSSQYKDYPTKLDNNLDCEIVNKIDELENAILNDGDIVYFAFAIGDFYEVEETFYVPCAGYVENPSV